MKSLIYPTPANAETSSAYLTITISKKRIFVSLLIVTAIVGMFFPISFVAFSLLVIGGAIVACRNFYADIYSIDFSSDKYSITLEEIIDDLEG